MNRSDLFVLTVVLTFLMAFYDRQEERRHKEQLLIQTAAASEAESLREEVEDICSHIEILTEVKVATDIDKLLDEIEKLRKKVPLLPEEGLPKPKEGLILLTDPFSEARLLPLQ